MNSILVAAKSDPNVVTDLRMTLPRGRMDGIRNHIRGVITPGTVLMMPTAPGVAPLLAATPAELDSYRTRAMGFTCIAGHGGLPQINTPAGSVDGVPVGISLVGWPGGDEILLDLAVSLTRFCGE